KYISAFTKKYKDPYRINMARQQVWDRKQFRGESTSNYLKAIQKIGANIGSSDEMFFAAMRGMNPEAARLMRLMGLTSFEALLSHAYQVDRDLQEERESAQRRDDAMFLRFRDMFFSRRS